MYLLNPNEVPENVDYSKVKSILNIHVYSVQEAGKDWYSLEDLCKYFDIKQDDYLDIMSELWHVDDCFVPYDDENLGWIIQNGTLVLATNFDEVCALIWYGASEEKKNEVRKEGLV